MNVIRTQHQSAMRVSGAETWAIIIDCLDHTTTGYIEANVRDWFLVFRQLAMSSVFA